MKRRYLNWTKTLAAGLMGAALALPLSPAAAVNPALGQVAGGVIGGGNLPIAEVVPPQTEVRWASTGAGLVKALSEAAEVRQAGDMKRFRVIIPAGASLDMSPYRFIAIVSNVEIIGERGPLGSRPLVYTRTKGFDSRFDPHRPVAITDPQTTSLLSFGLFELLGQDIRVEGIHFQGSAPVDRKPADNLPDTWAMSVPAYPKEGWGRHVVIADNEFDGWTQSGVYVYSDDSGQLGSNDAERIRVERNYFHHNSRLDDGYGVNVVHGGYATIEFNVFDFNRHAVSAGSQEHTGYVARFNYVLQGGYTYGDNGYYGQHFDVHGSAPGYNGGRAGEYFLIEFNTIRGEQDYGGFVGIDEKTRAAFELRGRPTQGAYFQNNVVVHDDTEEAIRLKPGIDPTLFPPVNSKFNLRESGNRYDTDYSTEVATGDFDGDGLTDVFVANGTAWFYSRAGQRPWEFLHASTKRTRDLALADIDNDGRTDVLYRDGSGNLGVLKSGIKDLVNLTTVPVSVTIQDLRFGDFDGDYKTDIFYTLGGQWHIWYGKSRAWTPTLGAALPASAMLFGEFDNVRGTDIVAALPDDWAVSSGGTVGWVKLNNRLKDSLAGAVAADFDGNGICDIAFNDGTQWIFSRDGRWPLSLLRSAGAMTGYPGLQAQLIGQFESDRGAEVVSFEYKKLPFLNSYYPGERLMIWKGLGTGNAYATHSEQNMR